MTVDLTVNLSDEAITEIAQRVAVILAKDVPRGRVASRWLTVDQAAEYLGSRPQRVYDLRSSGRLTRHGDGARALVDRRELDKLIEAGAR